MQVLKVQIPEPITEVCLFWVFIFVR